MRNVNSPFDLRRRSFPPTRILAMAGLTVAASGLVAQAFPQTSEPPFAATRSSNMPELESRHLFTISMTLPPFLDLGDTPLGNRRVFTVSGGQFNGERLRGDVLPQASSDLLLGRADGSFQQDARLLLRTDDGALILMTYRGVRHASPEVNARIARGERVLPSDYYLRTAPFFETSSPRYAWLNGIVAVGVGERQPDRVIYDVYEILQQGAKQMPDHSNFQLLNPVTMPKPAGYSHVARVTGGSIVFIAGQVALDASGNVVGKDDFRAQALQVFENLKAAVEAAGGTFHDVIKLNIYVLDSSNLPFFREVRDRYINLQSPPASTAVQVPRLFRPEFLVEVEAVAVVPIR